MKELLLTALLFLQVPAQLLPGVVTGQLGSRNGVSVAGIRVSALLVPESGQALSAASTIVSSAVTDNAGRYRLDNIPPGRYYLMAGFIDGPTYYPGVAALNAATVVSVSSGSTVRDMNFTMVVGTGVAVKGRVVRPAALENQRISMLLNGGGAASQSTTLAADGSFEFLKVRPGNYNLNISGATLAQTVSFAVADRDVTGIEVAVLRTAAVSGRIVVEGDGPPVSLSLTFSSFKGGVSNASIGAASGGQFRTQLPEGEYRVGWNAFPSAYFIKSITAGSTDLLTNPFVVSSSSAPPQVVVTLGVVSPSPWVKVSGKVIGATQFSRLSFLGTAGTGTIETEIRPDGSFEFSKALPGSYQVRLTPPLPIPNISFFVPNKDISDAEIVLPTLYDVKGRVVVEGRPPSAMNFSFIVNGSYSSAVVAQADGSFRMTLPAGDSRLTLNAFGYTVKSMTYGTTDVTREPLRVSTAGSEELKVTLTPSAIGAGVPGGVLGGVVGGVVGGIAPPPPPRPPVLIAPTEIPREIARVVEQTPTRVPESVLASNLVSRPAPAYPDAARQARIQGIVTLDVTIDIRGVVTNAQATGGPLELRQAATDAVKKWQYRPITVNGVVTPVIGSVSMPFSLP